MGIKFEAVERRVKKSCLGESLIKKSVPGTNKRRCSGMIIDFRNQKRQKMKDCSVKKCLNILKFLLDLPDSWGFKEPVDPVALNIPDYFSVIAKPMDLGTIKSKLEDGMYFGVDEFIDDVRLTFSNAMKYNPPSNYFNKMAKRLDSMFSSKLESLARSPASSLLKNNMSVEEKGKLGKDCGASKLGKVCNTDETRLSVAKSSLFKTNISVEEKGKLQKDCGVSKMGKDCVASKLGQDCRADDVQLSPKEAQRATMLKNQFSGTILKAKIKLLDLDHKVDTLKLQQEKERLEKQHQEEKARVEVALKLRAKEEIKIKRERQREAARIALQNMENTVAMCENLDILTETERFSWCISSGYLFDGAGDGCKVLGRFRSPLERLGLFLKIDYMSNEDEEYEVTSNGDVEEGEILY